MARFGMYLFRLLLWHWNYRGRPSMTMKVGRILESLSASSCGRKLSFKHDKGSGLPTVSLPVGGPLTLFLTFAKG